MAPETLIGCGESTDLHHLPLVFPLCACVAAGFIRGSGDLPARRSLLVKVTTNCSAKHGAFQKMDLVSSLVSQTVNKVLQFSGLVGDRNVVRSRRMEEKALEVYGEG